ncbi:MAG: hypothetical protein Q8Q18_02070 [bacterium]|nr:hypothetical protein [bacterium]
MSQFAKILLAVLALVALGIAYIYTAPTKTPQFSSTKDFLSIASSTSSASSSDFTITLPGTKNDSGAISIQESEVFGEGEITSITTDTHPTEAVPSLAYAIVKPDDLPDSAFVGIRNSIESISDKLAGDKYNYDLWLQLGLYRNIIRDYPHAREAWYFASLIRPSQDTAFINLGNLYTLATDLQNLPLAEKYYIQAKKLSPQDVNSYTRLFELYRYYYKDKRYLADDILLEALEGPFKGSLELHTILARFLREETEYTRAREQYEKAIAIASDRGQQETAQELEKELAVLPR